MTKTKYLLSASCEVEHNGRALVTGGKENSDFNLRMLFCLFVALIVVHSIYPTFFLSKIHNSIDKNKMNA